MDGHGGAARGVLDARVRRRTALRIFGAACVGTALARPGWSLAQASGDPYVVVELGTGDGDWSRAFGITNRGQVLWSWGTALDPARGLVNDPRVGIWDRGDVTDLSARGIERGVAIVDDGTVLGARLDQALRYRPDVGAPEPVPGFLHDAYPAGMNATGAVVGNVEGRPVVSGPNGISERPTPTGYGFFQPAAIDARGAVAGTVRAGRTDESGQRAALLDGGQSLVLDPAPGADSSGAADLNDEGLLAGGPGRFGMHSMVAAGRAFVFDASTGMMTDIGSLPGYRNSVAMAINNAGQVVGAAWHPLDEVAPFRRAFRYDHRTGAMTDLTVAVGLPPGAVVVDAFDINDGGEIAAQIDDGGQRRGVVLRPAA